MSKSKTEGRPIVGVGIMILKGKKVLLGKRKGSHGAEEYAFPGGHLESMESVFACGEREIDEECGIKVENMQYQFAANVRKYAPKHYVHIGLVAYWKSGKPVVREPDKVESWAWFDLSDLPQPLFEMTRLAIASIGSETPFYDH